MRLHLDPEAFEAFLVELATEAGIRPDILEKDYFVTLLLKELAPQQDEIRAYFKGGTALYKALGVPRRFSEDIDLTVFVEDLSTPTQKQKRLERAAEDYTCLPHRRDDPQNANHRGNVTCIYGYDSVVAVDDQDPLQRFGRVKVEATSFTVSEPTSPLPITPLLYTFARPDRRQILTANFDVTEFPIQTATLERIFVDKLFAMEDYYRHGRLPAVAKHIYDLAILLSHPVISNLLDDADRLETMIGYARLEATNRIGCDLAEVPLSAFSIWDEGIANEDLLGEFDRMQRIYVFRNEYLVSVVQMQSCISELRARLA